MGRRVYHLAMITGDNYGGTNMLCNDDAAHCKQQSNRAKERGGERMSQGGGGISFYDDPSIEMLSMVNDNITTIPPFTTKLQGTSYELMIQRMTKTLAGNVGIVSGIFSPKNGQHVGAMSPTRHRPCRRHRAMSALQMRRHVGVNMLITRHVGA